MLLVRLAISKKNKLATPELYQFTGSKRTGREREWEAEMSNFGFFGGVKRRRLISGESGSKYYCANGRDCVHELWYPLTKSWDTTSSETVEKCQVCKDYYAKHSDHAKQARRNIAERRRNKWAQQRLQKANPAFEEFADEKED